MTAFKAGIDQFFPYGGQVVQFGTEQIYTLTSSNLCIQIIFFANLADNDQFFGRNFSARNSRYHRIGAVTLNIGQKFII